MIVVKKRTSGTPVLAVPGYSGSFCDIGEAALSLVAVESILSPIRDKHVFESVIVDVPDTNPTSPAGACGPRLASDIPKSAMPFVPI